MKHTKKYQSRTSIITKVHWKESTKPDKELQTPPVGHIGFQAPLFLITFVQLNCLRRQLFAKISLTWIGLSNRAGDTFPYSKLEQVLRGATIRSVSLPCMYWFCWCLLKFLFVRWKPTLFWMHKGLPNKTGFPIAFKLSLFKFLREAITLSVNLYNIFIKYIQ